MVFLLKLITRKNLIYIGIALAVLLIAGLSYSYARARSSADTYKVKIESIEKDKKHLDEKIKEQNRHIEELGKEITILLQTQELMNESLNKAHEEIQIAELSQKAIQTDFSNNIESILENDENYVYKEETEYTFHFDQDTPEKKNKPSVVKRKKKELSEEAGEKISDSGNDAMWNSYCNGNKKREGCK